MSTNSKEYSRKYYAEHREMFREASRKYQAKKKLEKKRGNPWLLDRRVDYKTPTREDFKSVKKPTTTYSREYYLKNRERILTQQSQYQKAKRKKEKINAQQREYYAKNREHIRELQNKNRARRKRESKLSQSFFGRLWLKIEKFVKGK